jgi:hypothetical protein
MSNKGEQQSIGGVMHDANSPASKIVKPLIPPDAQERIERAVKQANASLREQIRVETGLRLSDGAERFAIPFRVSTHLRRLCAPGSMRVGWR